MAKISSLEYGGIKRSHKGKETEALYYIVDEFDEKYVQIDMFGSSEREFKEKVSQTIRINKDIAEKLIVIFKKEFNI